MQTAKDFFSLTLTLIHCYLEILFILPYKAMKSKCLTQWTKIVWIEERK